MAGLPPIVVRQPQPYDIVDDPILVAGVGTGFEGSFSARVRDGEGDSLTEIPIHAGGMGTWGNYQVEIALDNIPTTTNGTLEVFEHAASGDGSEINKVVVPIIFGRALIDPYHGFAQYTVAKGDTLSKIAKQWYDDAAQWKRIFEANRNQISNPDRIFPGQVLRIPQ